MSFFNKAVDILGVIGAQISMLGQSQENEITNPGAIIDNSNTAVEDITIEINEIELTAHSNQIHGPTSIHLNGHVTNGLIPHPPNPSNPVSHQGEPQESPTVDLKSESKIALGLFTLSAGSLVVVVVALFGERKTELTHPVVFQAFTSLNLISLISSSTMFLLALNNPNISYLPKIVRFAMCVSLDSLFLAYTWAASVLLLGNYVGMIVALASLLVFISINIIVCVFL